MEDSEATLYALTMDALAADAVMAALIATHPNPSAFAAVLLRARENHEVHLREHGFLTARAPETAAAVVRDFQTRIDRWLRLVRTG